MNLQEINPLTRESVIDFIINSRLYGNLGFFIGSGFSKAVVNTGAGNIALNWRELLETTATEFGIKLEDLIEDGKDYPSVATDLCQEISNRDRIKFADADLKIKEIISEKTNWTINSGEKEKYNIHFNKIDPDWIITTNYDLLIEQILSEKALSLEPNDALCLQDNLTPIYHLHGIRTNPRSIVISRNDYVSILRPNQYNQMRLSFALKESTTLFLGYKLGDINVLTAMDWSKNVFTQGKNNFPNEAIQFIRGNPTDPVYRDNNGVIIIKHNSIDEFLSEITQSIEKLEKDKNEKESNSRTLIQEYEKKLNETPNELITDQELRVDYFKKLAENSSNFDNLSLTLISPLLDKCWIMARQDGNFSYYNHYLKIIIDVINCISIQQHHTTILRLIANSLEKLIPFLGSGHGQAHAAESTWNREIHNLPNRIIEQIRVIAIQFNMENIITKLNQSQDN